MPTPLQNSVKYGDRGIPKTNDDPYDHEDMKHDAIGRLCESIKSGWPKSLGENSWYLVVTATFITCGQPDAIYPIFKHLVKSFSLEQKENAEAEIESFSTRVKELLMKLWTLIGIPLVISAVPYLARARADAHKSLFGTKDASGASCTKSEQSQESVHLPKVLDADLEEQGHDFMKKLYRHNLPTIMSTWGPYQADFEWLEKRIIYGLFLSDHSVLSEMETELVTLCGIMAQGLRQPTLWHIRGLRRLGVSLKDTEWVCDRVKSVARVAGKEDTDQWIKAKEVDPEFDSAGGEEEEDGKKEPARRRKVSR